MTTRIVTVPAATFAAVASLTVHAASRTDAATSPVLGGVQFTVTDGVVTGIATDRYTACRVVAPVLEDSAMTTATVIIPTDLLAACVKSQGRNRFDPVTIMWDDAAPEYNPLSNQFADPTVTISAPSWTHVGRLVAGNIPQIGRLIPEPDVIDDEAATPMTGHVTLNTLFLARLSKITNPVTPSSRAADKNRDAMWTFGQAPSERVGTVIATNTLGGHRFDAIVQPSIRLR